MLLPSICKNTVFGFVQKNTNPLLNTMFYINFITYILAIHGKKYLVLEHHTIIEPDFIGILKYIFSMGKILCLTFEQQKIYI